MSRSKKSRKPGGAPTAKPKLSKQELEKVDKRVRKTTGKVAGNRQKEATQDKSSANQSNVKKDPRLGNKTPIALGKIVANADKAKQEKAQQSKQNAPAVATVRFVENAESGISTDESSTLSPEERLEAIEQDEELQSILAKQEDGIALTEQEVDYYNDMMERHETLSAELGIEEDDSEDDEAENNSEDALWDKLDNSDLTDFEEK